MKTILPWIIAAVSLLAAVYLYFQKTEAESRLAMADTKVEELTARKEAEDSLESMILPPDTMTLVPPTEEISVNKMGSLTQSEIKKLQRKGLQNPETDLKKDLTRNQSTLIPVKGTMGGTMAIRKSHILNGNYALAYYEDGHNGGNLLLKYNVSNGSITWTVIDHSKL
ncbi:hypothetical protein [Pontibacter arcticus]|uniref:Uncharacterized protein n=1 Tax=Pontibacter arcticus TaxID=2080288 RepID=A0A364RDS5_9BACT|nr:hypothetical protein [Pontibacter arcticus]RAU82395.1 hypothetical protein DP923_11460 [Pontibacter arcticus]